jgi:hypothetical protein
MAMRTFDEFCADYTLTEAERTALVWHLATFRARNTVEALLLPRARSAAQRDAASPGDGSTGGRG